MDLVTLEISWKFLRARRLLDPRVRSNLLRGMWSKYIRVISTHMRAYGKDGRPPEDNGMYIREQIQFEWISSKLKMADWGLPADSSFSLTYFSTLLPSSLFSSQISFFPHQFFDLFFFFSSLRPVWTIFPKLRSSAREYSAGEWDTTLTCLTFSD